MINKLIILITAFGFLTACTLDNGMNAPVELAKYLQVEENDLKHIVEFEKAKQVFYIPSNSNPAQGEFDVGLAWL